MDYESQGGGQRKKRHKFYAREWEGADRAYQSPFEAGDYLYQDEFTRRMIAEDRYEARRMGMPDPHPHAPKKVQRKPQDPFQQQDADAFRHSLAYGDEWGIPAESQAVMRQILAKSGEPLGKENQEFFESRMGENFSDVRIHADAEAAKSAESIQAKAYTTGNDIVFGEGEYNPGSAEGKHLLAHELAHVVQQRDGRTEEIQRKPIKSDVPAGLYETAEGFEGSVYPGSVVKVTSGGALWNLSRAFERLGLNISVSDLQDYYGLADATLLQKGTELKLPLVDKLTGLLLLQAEPKNRALLNELGRFFNYRFTDARGEGVHISRAFPDYTSAQSDSVERLAFIAAALPAFRQYLVSQPFSQKYNRNTLTGPQDAQREQKKRLRNLFGDGGSSAFDIGGASGFFLGGAQGALSSLMSMLTLTDNAQINQMYSEREAAATQKEIEAVLAGKDDAFIAGALMKYSLGTVFGTILTGLILSRLRLGSRMKSSIGGKRTIVWKHIEITQPFYPGTAIPKSFRIQVGDMRLWVHPNATEHMMDFIKRSRRGYEVDTQLIDAYRMVNSQMILTDFHGALRIALRKGMKYGDEVNVGPWEFIFSRPRQKGLDPVIHHANYFPGRQ